MKAKLKTKTVRKQHYSITLSEKELKGLIILTSRGELNRNFADCKDFGELKVFGAALRQKLYNVLPIEAKGRARN